MSLRKGFMAISVLIGVALLGLLAPSALDLLLVSRHAAVVNENTVAMDQLLRRYASVLTTQPFRLIQDLATGEGPDGDLLGAVHPDSHRVEAPLLDGSMSEILAGVVTGLTPEDLELVEVRSDSLRVGAYLHLLAPGYAELALVGTWVEGPTGRVRTRVLVELIEDPSHF